MREAWIDRWRGILMLAIVVFHVIGALRPSCMSEAESVLSCFYEQLATFHTKGFFFIAGLLWRSGDMFGSFLKRKARRLLVPYFVFGIAWALLFAAIGDRFSMMVVTDAQTDSIAFWHPFVAVLRADGWPNGMGFRVINALWFLPCLFLVEVCYYWLDRALPCKYWQLLLLPVCFALNQLLSKPDVFWSFNLVPRFLIFFIIGRTFVGLKGVRINKIVALVIASGLFTLVCQPYVVKSLCTLIGFWGWFDILRGLCGIIACAMLAYALPIKMLAVFGCSTIGVLVTHKAFIMVFQLLHLQITSTYMAMTTVAAVSVVVSITSFVATSVLRRWFKWSLGE